MAGKIKTRVYTKMPFSVFGAAKKLNPKSRAKKTQEAIRKATGAKKK